MSQVKFGKVNAFPPKFQRATRSDRDSDVDSARFTLWVIAGVVTGFLAAAIECL